MRVIYGASNELADHLLAGAPGDVFISADAAPLDRLASAGMIAHNSRRSIAENSLTIVGAAEVKSIKKVSDLQNSRFTRVAIAEPECPLGKFSRAYLQANKIYDRLQPKLLEVDNSRAVLAAVDSGAVNAGIAFASDAARSETVKTLLTVPADQSGSVYEAVIVRQANARRRTGEKRSGADEEASRLLEFLTSRAAAHCFQRCGLRSIQR